MYTHVTFVLDSSGSMSAIRDDTIGGFNTFLTDQRAEEGTASVSLYDFNTHVTELYQGRPIADAPRLDESTFKPSGQTALYDAIATAIQRTTAFLASLDSTDRPDHVVFVVLTDGHENASETPQAEIRDQVAYRSEEFDWEFLFIGANQDAALTAERVGIDRGNSLDMAHSGDGAQAAHESVSNRVSNIRNQVDSGSFTEEDRQRQRDAERST